MLLTHRDIYIILTVTTLHVIEYGTSATQVDPHAHALFKQLVTECGKSEPESCCFGRD